MNTYQEQERKEKTEGHDQYLLIHSCVLSESYPFTPRDTLPLPWALDFLHLEVDAREVNGILQLALVLGPSKVTWKYIWA